MALQWYTVEGTADRGEVTIKAQVLTDSPERAQEEALSLAGIQATWKDAPVVEIADQAEDAE